MQICLKVLLTLKKFQSLFANIWRTDRAVDEHSNDFSCLLENALISRTQDHSRCFQYLVSKIAAPYAISPLPFAAHQGGEKVKMASLVKPTVLFRKKLRTPKSVRNKGVNVAFHIRRNSGNRFHPPLIAFPSL